MQTYSDGSVVRWDQPTQAGKTEPEHPAPSLTVGGEASASTGASAAASAAATPSPSAAGAAAPVTAAAPAAAVANTTDDTARYAAIGALALAVVALILAGGAFARARR